MYICADNRHGQYENRNHGQGEQYTYVKDDRDRYRPYNQYHGNYYNQYGSYPDRNTDYDKYQVIWYIPLPYLNVYSMSQLLLLINAPINSIASRNLNHTS